MCSVRRNLSDDPNNDFLIRVVAVLMGAIIGSEILLIVGRGLMCALRGGCPYEELVSTTEMLTGLLATLIALVFALTRGPKDPKE